MARNVLKMHADHRKIFREASLKKQLEGENNDEPLIVAPTYLPLSMLFLAICGFIIVLWLFFGALAVPINGKGIFMPKGGGFGVETQTSGIVKELLATTGSQVKKGDLLAIVYNPQNEVALRFAQQQLTSLEEAYENYKSVYALEDQKIKEAITKQIEANKKKIAKLQEQIPKLEKEYQKKLELSKEGLVSTSNVLDSEKLLLQLQTALESTKATITSLESKFKKSYRAEELETIHERILEQQQAKKLLELNVELQHIYSPFDARVLESFVNIGDSVVPGKNIFWVELATGTEAASLFVYAFSYSEVGKRIIENKELFIQPLSINQQEYGSIIGHVMSISPYPIGVKEIETYIHSEGLEAFLTSGVKTPFLLTLKPELDPSTVSGYKWTSSSGIPFQISTGTVCLVTGIAYYERPIVRLFPYWRIENAMDYFEKLVQSFLESFEVEPRSKGSNERNF